MFLNVGWRAALAAAVVAITLPAPAQDAAKPPSAAAGTVHYAWFYKPPRDESVVTARHVAGAYHLVLTRGDEELRNRVRGAEGRGTTREWAYIIPEPEGPGDLTEAGKTTTDNDYASWRNGVIFRPNQFRDEIHPHDDWFLHVRNEDGTRGRRINSNKTGAPTRTFYHMDPASAGWRQYFWDGVIQVLKTPDDAGQRWLRVYVDNVSCSLSKIRRLHRSLTGKTGPSYEYADKPDPEKAYREAWLEFMRYGKVRLRAAFPDVDVPLAGNMIEHGGGTYPMDLFFPVMDAVLDEEFGVGYASARYSPERTRASLEQARRAVAAGKHLICVVRSAEGDDAMHPYYVGLYRLIEGPDTSLRVARGYSDWLAVEAYHVNLGAPLEPYAEETPGSGVFRRRFERGTIRVNINKEARAGLAPQTAEFKTGS